MIEDSLFSFYICSNYLLKEMHFLWEQVFVTGEVIDSMGIMALTQPILQYNRQSRQHKIKISAHHSFQKTNQLALQLALLSNFPTIGKPHKKWLISTQKQLQNPMVSHFFDEYCAVFMVTAQNQDEMGLMQKCIRIRQMRQVLQIVLMSQKQFQRRIKMQILLNKSKQKYIKKQSNSKIIQLSNKVCEHNFHKNINILHKFMKITGKKRFNILHKFFTQWTIFYYQRQVQAQENEIIQGKYLQKYGNMQILNKYFNFWKKMSKFKQ